MKGLSKPAHQGPVLQLEFEPIQNFKRAQQTDFDKKHSMGGRGYYLVSPDDIYIRPNFNVREDMGNITALANSMLKNGQQTTCKGIPLDNGKFLIIEGHRRYAAAVMLHHWGHTGFKLKCHALERDLTEIDFIKMMFISQDNKQLTDNEVGKCFKILVDNGWTQKQIAEDLGKTPAYVNQMLKYNTEAQEIKDFVAAGHISAHTVVKLQGQIPDQDTRTKKIKEAVTRKTIVVKELPVKVHQPDNDNDEDVFEADIKSSDGSNLEAGEAVNRHANYKSSAKQEIDTIENASGKAIIEPAVAKVSVNDVLGKKTKRERMNELVEKLDGKYNLKLDEPGKKELFDLVCEYC